MTSYSRKLFGEEEAKDSLISFLNAILGLKDAKKLVTIETIGNTELLKRTDRRQNIKVGRQGEDNGWYTI